MDATTITMEATLVAAQSPAQRELAASLQVASPFLAHVNRSVAFMRASVLPKP